MLFVKGTADNYTLSQLVNYGKTSSTLNSSLVPITRLPAGLVPLDAIYYIKLRLGVLIHTPVTVNIFVAMLFIPGLIGN